MAIRNDHCLGVLGSRTGFAENSLCELGQITFFYKTNQQKEAKCNWKKETLFTKFMK